METTIIIITAGVLIYTAFMFFLGAIVYHWGYGDLKIWLKNFFRITNE